MKIFQREAIKCDLAAQVLRSTGELRLRALGLSMLPSLWPGDILSIQSCTFEDVARGDIVLCSREGQFVIHRIAGKSEDRQFLITQGDGLPRPDGPVPRRDLLGKVTAIERHGSVHKPKRAVPVSHRIFSLALWHWNLLLRIAMQIHVRRNFSLNRKPANATVEPT